MINKYISVRRWGVWVQLLEGQGPHTCVLVLRECVWKVPAVSFVLPAYDDTCSPGFSSMSGGLSPWFHSG